MKRELSSHEIDRLLDGARETWKAANERDDALERKPSERRLREPSAASRWTLRDVTPIALCAVACIVVGLLLRSGSVPKESIRPEALLAPPRPAPVVAPAEPAPEATAEAAASTSLPALPRPTATQPRPATPTPPSTLPQLPKVEPPPEIRTLPSQPRSIKSFFEADGSPVPPIPPRPSKHRHPRFGPEGPPGQPPHLRGKGRIHAL